MQKLITTLIAAIIAITSFQAVSANEVEVVRETASRPILIDMDIANCQRQPHLPWCGGEAPVGTTQPTWHDIIAIDRDVRRNWQPEETHDWGSHYDKMKEFKAWKADCDGFVYTAIEHLIAKGFAVDNVLKAVIGVRTMSGYDHMVALVRINGEWYVFADTMRRGIYPLSKVKWKIYMTSKVTEKVWARTQIVKSTQMAAR